jgi:hypothetical protein
MLHFKVDAKCPITIDRQPARRFRAGRGEIREARGHAEAKNGDEQGRDAGGECAAGMKFHGG